MRLPPSWPCAFPRRSASLVRGAGAAAPRLTYSQEGLTMYRSINLLTQNS